MGYHCFATNKVFFERQPVKPRDRDTLFKLTMHHFANRIALQDSLTLNESAISEVKHGACDSLSICVNVNTQKYSAVIKISTCACFR